MIFADVFRGKTVWLSGHTGFKGAWLAHWLLRLGATVRGFALEPPTQPALFDMLGLAGRLQHQIGDVRDGQSVRKSVEETQPDYVFHLAAQPLLRASYDRPEETYATNVMGTVNVLEALRGLTKPCAAVLITTDKCYENREWVYGYREEDPLGGYDPYSSSKAAAEIAISAWRRSFFGGHPVSVASARAGNVIGGGDWAADRLVPDCIRALQAKQPIPVRNKVATRPWQHVLEPLSGYLWLAALLGKSRETVQSPKSNPLRRRDSAARVQSRAEGDEGRGSSDGQSPAPGQPTLDTRHSPLASAFNFGPTHDSNRSVDELVTEVLKHWPGRWEDRSDPQAVHEAKLLQLATDKAHALLGWSPVWGFATTVERTISWYREVAADPRQAASLTTRQIEQYETDAHQAGLPWAKT
jgi:CDP-glucose 4,6-dehydratase